MSSPSTTPSESLDTGSPLSNPVDVLPPGSLIGRYVILHLVGEGGAGLVYAAYDGELDRKLALKFLRFHGDSQAMAQASRRLKREAQAMARLSHPNVVSIHDVGKVSGHMFLVMDFVAGGTLKDWLAQPRPWQERLDLLCRAGDGLAAAHAAGIVHRDFKPSNVLVDGDQPRVTDFGIAAAERQEPTPLAAHDAEAVSQGPAPASPAAAPPRSPNADTVQTMQTEGILGTVGYLAPEQAFALPVDARCDQFSFCVTLYEALYGILPFPRADLVGYIDAINAGAPRPPPSDTRVPRSIHAAILRGLSDEPGDRFPSMAELLEELRRDRDAPRRRWMVAAALALAVVVLGLFVRSRTSAPLCPPPDAQLGGAWTPAMRDRIGAAFARVTPYGAQAYAPLAAAIDRYAGSVANMRQDACVAARVHATQSETVMTLRLECLEDRARELEAFTQLLATADAKTVGRAAESLTKLSPVAECADVAALTAPVPAPSPAVAAAVDAARAELAKVKAINSIAHFAEAVDRAQALVARAQATGYAPVIAEAQSALANALFGEGRDEEADRMYRAAIDTADEGKHDHLRGQMYIYLSLIDGRRLGHYDVAIAQAETALHIARRLGSQLLEADALEQMGTDHGQTGLLEQGLNESTQALAMKERLEGPDDLDCAGTHAAVSVALSELGRFDEALREDRRAIAIVEHDLGPTHPDVGVYDANLSVDLVWAGHAEEAIPVAEEAMHLLESAVGKDHPDYAMALNDKSYALTKLGRFAEARPLNEEAVAISERVGGVDSSGVAYPLVGLGEDWIGLGEPQRALPILERATRIAEASGLDPETMGECHYHLARAVWLATHDRARAAALARKASADYGRSPRLASRARAAEAFALEREARGGSN